VRPPGSKSAVSPGNLRSDQTLASPAFTGFSAFLTAPSRLDHATRLDKAEVTGSSPVSPTWPFAEISRFRPLCASRAACARRASASSRKRPANPRSGGASWCARIALAHTASAEVNAEIACALAAARSNSAIYCSSGSHSSDRWEGSQTPPSPASERRASEEAIDLVRVEWNPRVSDAVGIPLRHEQRTSRHGRPHHGREQRDR